MISKSLLTFAGLGLTLGLLSLGGSAVTSSNASVKQNELTAAQVTRKAAPEEGSTEGWSLFGGINNWSTAVEQFKYDSKAGLYSMTITITDDILSNAEKNAFKFTNGTNWINFGAIHNFRNLDESVIKVNYDQNSSFNVAGTYKFSYIHSRGENTKFWIEDPNVPIVGEKIYVATDLNYNGSRKGANYLFVKNNDDNRYPLGTFPGTPIDKLNNTSFFSTSNMLNFNDNGGVFEIDTSLFPKANKLILCYSENDNNAQAQSTDMYYANGWTHYYSSFQAPASDGGTINGSAELYPAAKLAFELSAAINESGLVDSEIAGNNQYYSVCNITKEQAEDFQNQYNDLTNELAKTTFDSSTFYTRDDTNTNPENKGNGYIKLSDMMVMMPRIIAKGSGSSNSLIIGNGNSNSSVMIVAAASIASIALGSMLFMHHRKRKQA